MKSVIVASTNPVKLQAVRQGFARMFPAGHFSVCPLMVAAAVSDQPLTDGETRLGALARAIAAREKLPDAEFWVGIEGGVDQIDGHMAAFAWVAILSQSGEGFSRSGTFFLPEKSQILSAPARNWARRTILSSGAPIPNSRTAPLVC